MRTVRVSLLVEQIHVYTYTCVIEDSSRVALQESLCKQLHDTVDFLRLSRQVEAGEKHSDGVGGGGGGRGGRGRGEGTNRMQLLSNNKCGLPKSVHN